MNQKRGDFLSQYAYSSELYHHGIKGQKWGVRRFRKKDGSLTPAGEKRYSSTGLKSAIARRQNEKVDKSFNNWKENTQKRDNAIALGKKANVAKLAYEKDRSNKQLKSDYKQANKEYKKALNENTTYRKGVVKKEVGQDASRKYLSEAKQVKKKLDSDPSNKALQKQYNDLMSKHDVERAKARRVDKVAANRSRMKASMKGMATKTVKGLAATAAVSAGLAVANRYVLHGKYNVNSEQVLNWVKKGRKAMQYF